MAVAVLLAVPTLATRTSSGSPGIPAAAAPVPDTYPGIAAEARRLGDRVRTRHGSRPQSVALFASILGESGDHEAAAAAWRAHLERDPGTAEGWYRLGLLEARAGNDEEAAAMLERAIGLDASLPDVQSHLGRTLLKLDRVDEAARVLEPAVGDDRGGAVRLFHLGHARLAQGRADEAHAAFRGAVDRAPAYTGAWYGLATAAARLGRDAEAEEAREEFRRLKERDAAAAAANLERDEAARLRQLLGRWYASAGRIAALDGDAAAAESAWKRGLAVAPEVADNRRLLVEFYRDTGRAREAARLASGAAPPGEGGP